MSDSHLIYGHHPVTEAIRAGKAVEKVYFQQGERGEVEKEIRHLTKEYGIPLQVVPREKLNKMVRGQHQGVVAYLSLVEYQNIEDILPFVFEQGETPLLVMLDSVTDVRNFGAIVRSAECAGAHAVIVPQSGSALANEEAMKGAQPVQHAGMVAGMWCTDSGHSANGQKCAPVSGRSEWPHRHSHGFGRRRRAS
jgi:23S rRNA (guanosine2251-2'-O)-methyltransferase